jgi:hypothetical protein
MTIHIAADLGQVAKGQGTPEEVLESIVDGINTGNLDAVMLLYEPHALLRRSQGSSLLVCRASVNR